MKKTIFTLFLLILLTGCSNQQENRATKTKITNNENNLKKESDLAIYYPSEQINKNLEEFSNELSVALFRGDAKSAPTYTETIVKIKKSQKKLQNALDLFKTESTGKTVLGRIDDNFLKFKKTNDAISMALAREDTEIVPTHEEFFGNMGSISYEFWKIYKEYTAVKENTPEVFIKTENNINYVVYKNTFGKEVIIDQAELSSKQFIDVKFSPRETYIIYSDKSWEHEGAKMFQLYEISRKKKVDDIFYFNLYFTPDEAYLYICSPNNFLWTGKVFTVGDFKEVYDVHGKVIGEEKVEFYNDYRVMDDCKYDEKKERIEFNLVHIQDKNKTKKVFFDLNYQPKKCITTNGKAGFILTGRKKCYAVGENIMDTDCIVSSTGGCEPLGH